MIYAVKFADLRLQLYGGVVVSLKALYSYDPSSNPAEVNRFSVI